MCIRDSYEVLDYHDDASFPELMEAVGHFNEGVVQYRGANWDKAAAQFHETLRCNPEDRLSQTYIDRCTYFKSQPPGDDWNGVWVMTSK